MSGILCNVGVHSGTSMEGPSAPIMWPSTGMVSVFSSASLSRLLYAPTVRRAPMLFRMISKLAGQNPAVLGTAQIRISFDVCSVVSENSSVDTGAATLTMVFGETRANPGVTLGFSDGNHLMYSDAPGHSQIFTSYTFNPSGWDRITLAMDFGTDTYDPIIQPMTGTPMLPRTWGVEPRRRLHRPP